MLHFQTVLLKSFEHLQRAVPSLRKHALQLTVRKLAINNKPGINDKRVKLKRVRGKAPHEKITKIVLNQGTVVLENFKKGD